MHDVHDIAAYILVRKGKMTAMKLQKLVYYSQAWSLVWDSKPLFKNKIEAWANGPVVRELYEEHRGKFEIASWPKGDADQISGVAKETIDAVLGFYGKKSAHWLSELSHREAPWRDARRGLAAGERGSAPISRASMAEYYGGLTSA